MPRTATRTHVVRRKAAAAHDALPFPIEDELALALHAAGASCEDVARYLGVERIERCAAREEVTRH